MKRFIFYISVIAIAFASGCAGQKKTVPVTNAIIPRPASLKTTDEFFTISKNTRVIVRGSDSLARLANYLIASLGKSADVDLALAQSTDSDAKGNIILEQTSNISGVGEEGYELNVTEENVSIKAKTLTGIFYGIQTLRQSIGDDKSNTRIPGMVITDKPVYGFRSSMLDVARHFFTVDEIKRYIDLIAFYKMNYLHLHLTDDQGWRIEIKSWPKLTSVGGVTEIGDEPGGFYTQEQYRELVVYAAERFITIIPEVDIPGHTNAALASYAELNCDGKAPAIYQGTQVGFSTLCASKEVTFKFLDDVVKELAAITPGPYIHLGGDESHATKKEDYILFASKMQQIVEAHGKKMIGWEEIAQGTLTPGTVIQYWNSANYAQEAAKKGAKIIMSPAKRVYLDMKYDKSTKLGQDWAARIEISDSYDWSPSKLVSGISNQNIIGIEAPLWTETITNMEEIEYMVFPRLPGIAELAWSPEEGKSWEEYRSRLAKHGAIMKEMKINYYKSPQIQWGE